MANFNLTDDDDQEPYSKKLNLLFGNQNPTGPFQPDDLMRDPDYMKMFNAPQTNASDLAEVQASQALDKYPKSMPSLGDFEGRLSGNRMGGESPNIGSRYDASESPPSQTLQDGPDTRSTMDNSSSAMPKKQSFLQKLFGGGDQAGEKDEYGLTTPQAPKMGILSKLLGVALPTIYGATHGVGGFGALTGLNSLGKDTENQYNQQLTNYQKNRGLAEKQLYGQSKLAEKAKESQATNDYRKQMLNGTQDYRKQMLSIGQQNADSNSTRATAAKSPKTMNDRDTFIQLTNDLKSGVPMDAGKLAWLKAYKDRQDKLGS